MLSPLISTFSLLALSLCFDFRQTKGAARWNPAAPIVREMKGATTPISLPVLLPISYLSLWYQPHLELWCKT